MNPPKKLLVPVDFSEPSERALDYAVELAHKLDAEITVMHAYEIPSIGFPDGALLATSEVAARILTGVQTALTALVDARKDRGITVKSLIKQDEPWRAILSAVEDTKSDLVVMGTHGRRGLPRALLGSVTEKVVRTAQCPVLTLRSPEPKG